MRVLFAAPGLHRYNRGAEVAFIAIANELAAMGETVTLIGSGQLCEGNRYGFLHAGSVAREHFEKFPVAPVFRNEFAYEDLTFALQVLRQLRPDDFDVTLTCSFPFTNWILRRPLFLKRRPPHIFVTQNGDWPARARNAEYRFFGCEGLVCTNPDYLEWNQGRWHCCLIPNGVDCERFQIGAGQRARFGLPAEEPVVLMVSALEPTKRVSMGIEAVSRIPGAHLIVAGDGPLRGEIDRLANRLLPARFKRLLVRPEEMPILYQSADVFLHLSKIESFGNVYLEAISSGLPIVAYDSPRTRWIVGENEYLTSCDNPDDIARQIELAKEERSNNKQVRALRAREFSWRKVAEKYKAFLHEVARSE
jgi:glycosyltransferase involved in cell wall biosynthesis